MVIKTLDKLKEATDLLKNCSIDYAERDAEIILTHCLGIDRVTLYRDNPDVSEKQAEQIYEFLTRRSKREPLHYIIGYVEFYGLKIKIGKGVLIPRPETELLVEEAIKTITSYKLQVTSKDKDSSLSILDLCTGSGCVALALARKIPDADVYGTDTSEIAIRYAKENAELNSITNVTFLIGNLFEPIKKHLSSHASHIKFDLIVSNPPYVKKEDIKNLQPEIKDWEPVEALNGGEDGLGYYSTIIPEAKKYLKERGHLLFELGVSQADSVRKMVKDAGFTDVSLIKDYAGIERILRAKSGILYVSLGEWKMGILEENRRLEELDKKYIWHPFTQMKDWLDEKPIIISEGKDCFIKDIYGRWYLDGVSSLWVTIHGHRKKEIDDAIKEQLDTIAHSTLLGLSNVSAIKLAEKLVQMMQTLFSLPPHPPLTKIFYSDNGSTAVEVALKMAFQYWKHKGIGGKNTFVSLNNAYHGDTIGAVSVGGIDIFHKAFGPLLFKTYKAPSPYCYRCELGREYPECTFACLNEMEEIFKMHGDEIAAFIIEPLIQAAGGMITSPPGYLKGVRELCTKYNILMIADEVATGFGRTGKMFACEHESVVPDIMCLSKGITGGYMPFAVTISTDEIYNVFLGEFKDLKTFFHGHSYTGNPLACAAALACLNLFEKEQILKNLKGKIQILESWLKEVLNLQHVGDVRNVGLMAGVELVKDKKTKEPYDWEEKTGWRVAYYARDNGVFIRPLGNVIVIMPPLSISKQNLNQLLNIIKDSIVTVTER